MTGVAIDVAVASAEGGAAGPALCCDGLVMVHGHDRVLDGASLTVGAGECVALRGPSGSGKTTLLHIAAGLIVPTEGRVELGGRQLGTGERARARARLEAVGMVFQFGELIPELTVAENVGLPLHLQGRRDLDRCHGLLGSLGLSHRVDALPETLSGGEVQRAAIARALVGSPSVVLADEPTGALDEELSCSVIELLVASARELGVGLLVATHDPLVAARMDRRLVLRNGVVERDL